MSLALLRRTVSTPPVTPTILMATPFVHVRPKGWQTTRNGGRDPTELALTVQPANTARPVGPHKSHSPPAGYEWTLNVFVMHGGWVGCRVERWSLRFER